MGGISEERCKNEGKKENISNTNSGQCDYRIEIENMHDLNGRKEGEKNVIYRHQRWYDRRYARGK